MREEDVFERQSIPMELALILEMALDVPVMDSIKYDSIELWPAWRFVALAYSLSQIEDYRFCYRGEISEAEHFQQLRGLTKRLLAATFKHDTLHQKNDFITRILSTGELSALLYPFSLMNGLEQTVQKKFSQMEQWGWYLIDSREAFFSYTGVCGADFLGNFTPSFAFDFKYDEFVVVQGVVNEMLRRMLFGINTGTNMHCGLISEGWYPSIKRLLPPKTARHFLQSHQHFTDKRITFSIAP